MDVLLFPFSVFISFPLTHDKYVFLYGVFEGLTCIIAAAYIPPTFPLEAIHRLKSDLSENPSCPFLNIEDLNMVQDETEGEGRNCSYGIGAV